MKKSYINHNETAEKALQKLFTKNFKPQTKREKELLQFKLITFTKGKTQLYPTDLRTHMSEHMLNGL